MPRKRQKKPKRTNWKKLSTSRTRADFRKGTSLKKATKKFGVKAKTWEEFFSKKTLKSIRGVKSGQVSRSNVRRKRRSASRGKRRPESLLELLPRDVAENVTESKEYVRFKTRHEEVETGFSVSSVRKRTGKRAGAFPLVYSVVKYVDENGEEQYRSTRMRLTREVFDEPRIVLDDATKMFSQYEQKKNVQFVESFRLRFRGRINAKPMRGIGDTEL